MTIATSQRPSVLPLRFKHGPVHSSWWAPLWRGLVVDVHGQHYRRLHSAIWLHLYLIVHANRQTGKVYRKVSTIASDMGLPETTIKRWFRLLIKQDYIVRGGNGRSTQISILRWKPMTRSLPSVGPPYT